MTHGEPTAGQAGHVPLRSGTLLLLAALVLSLGGCGGHGPSRRTPPPDAPGPGAPTGTLVEFERHGGIAGFSDRLTVRADGRFTVVRSRPALTRTGRLGAAELADLRARLAGADLARLPARQLGHGSDLFTYLVTADGVQVLAQDGAVAQPLRPLITALVALIDGSAPSTGQIPPDPAGSD